MENKDFSARLDAVLRQFETEKTLDAYNDFLEVFFSGIRDNDRLPVLFDLDFEKQDGQPLAVKYEDGTEALMVLTNLSEESRAYAVSMRMRSFLNELDQKETRIGIVFNPGHDDLFLSKGFIQSLVDTGYQMLMDEIEEEAALRAARRSEKELLCKRPMDAAEFETLAERIRAFDENRDDFLTIRFLNDEELLFAEVFRVNEPGMRQLNFGYDMDDFEWDEPLKLGDALDVEKTIGILKKVCVDAVSTDRIEEVNSFRKIG